MFSCWSVCITDEEHENWCVSLSLTICKYWQRMWTVVTCPSCFPITAASKESPPTVKMKDGRGQILCSLWWRLYRMLIYNFVAELLRPEVGKTIWQHNIHVNIFILPQCVYILKRDWCMGGMPTHAHTHLTIKWQNKQCIEERRAWNKTLALDAVHRGTMVWCRVAQSTSKAAPLPCHLLMSRGQPLKLTETVPSAVWVGGALLCTHNSRLTAGC